MSELRALSEKIDRSAAFEVGVIDGDFGRMASCRCRGVGDLKLISGGRVDERCGD